MTAIAIMMIALGCCVLTLIAVMVAGFNSQRAKAQDETKMYEVKSGEFRPKRQNTWMFSTAPDATPTVKKVYADLLSQREKELRLFNAYQECPKCQQTTWAFFTIASPWDLLRECANCGHQWLQKK